jgi:hypothetical protein
MTTERDHLKLTAARVEMHDGYPVLILEIAGRTARIDTEWKPAFRELGLVCLGEGFADLVPRRTYRDPKSGGVTNLLGFTNDPRIFDLMARFWSGTIRPGEKASF